MPKTKDRRTEPWTGAEDALVQRWMLEGWKAEAIAVQIGRTASGIYMRRNLLHHKARQPQDQLV